jgi:hypothetical protein
MRRALLLRILHLHRNAILFLLLLLMLLYFSIPGIRSAELNYIRQDEAIHVTLVIFGGYEGGQTKIDLYSGSLLSKCADTLRQMINDADFFQSTRSYVIKEAAMLRLLSLQNYSGVTRKTTCRGY